ncbi:MAG: hypothetical protein RDV48_00575 [Candidatus Eremiobacteraeota bacterium]|nr:hypothetical protein [Candidatus Eremiobacteraeota bacterium]
MRYPVMILLLVMLATSSGQGVASPQKSRAQSEKLVSMSYVRADLVPVLNRLARDMGLNIVVDPKVTGTVTVELKNVPALSALNLVVTTNGYNYKVLDGTVVVGTDEMLQKLPSNLMTMQAEKVTEALRLAHADPGEIIGILQKLYPHATLQEDSRLRAVIVTADRDTIKKIRALIYGSPEE